LTAQIDTLKTQVAGQQARSAGLETANRDLQSNVSDLKQPVARVNAENETLKTQQAQKLAAGNSAELARLKAQVDDTAGALAERDAKIATLTSQAQSLQLDVENARKSAEAALAAQSAAAQAVPEAKAMLLEIQTLQAHSAQLESQLAEDRARSANALSTLAAQLKLANETNESLAEANRSLISAQKSGAVTLKGDLDNANKQVAELTALNERITQDRDEQKRQAGNLSGRLGQAEAQLTALREATARAESAADELEQVKARLAERDAAIDKQGDSVAELTGLNADLGKERDQLLSRLLQAQESLKQSSAKVEALQAETDRLRASDTLAANLQKELEDTRRKSADAEQRVQLRTAAESRLTDEKAGLQQQLDMVNARLDSLRAENSRLAGASTALAEAEARLATLSAASTQLSEAQRTLGDLRTENARLKDSVQALDRDRTSRVAALQQENAALSARLRQAQGTLDQIAAAARLMNPSASPQTASGGTPARTSTEVSQTPRYHTVAEGDSLSRISLRYYGTANRWQEIYEANRAVLSQENVLRPGQQLVLP
ncbi:MAG: LysM peptidoglycan-binding domain-containing protein, partial [Opitutaceae bacterium]|nr:LysM peptidoglycan-binding domain-containing protein [Opitutaceae bacterium]